MELRARLLYVLWMVVCTAAYFTVPSAHALFAFGMGAGTVAAMAYGVVRHRPRRRAPWVLLGSAVCAFVAGDVINMYLTDVQHVEDPFPSLGDAFYIAVYPLLALGLIRLLRSGAAVRDRASLLDALTLTAGLGLLSWIYLINPLISTPDLTTLEKSVAVAYPLGDVLLVTVLVRMATSFRRSRGVILLVTGLGLLLVGDVVYSVLQLTNTYTLGGAVDLLYFACYGCLAGAALHPSMVRLTEPRVLRPTQVGRGRVVLLGLASLIPPAVLIGEAAHGDVPDATMIGVLSAVLFALVVARLAGVVGAHRLVIARELGLRRAGAAMLAATSVDEVTAAVRAAIADLLPANAPHQVVVTVGGPAGDGDPAPEMRILRPADDPTAVPTLAGFDHVLRCPLPGRRVTGHLDIGVDDTALVALQEAAQVLASQAALALESLAANAEVVQRESETYFRTLVQNAADVIVIVDDEGRIRYASPSAAAMFGTRPDGRSLVDLLHPADRAAARALLAVVRAGHAGPELVSWAVGEGADPVQVEVSCRDLRHEPTVGGLVVTLRDVTEHRRLERELLHRAYYDPLTGLPNRALFTERLERAVGAVTGSAAVAAVVLVGVDDFKVINDTMGYDAGDALLAAVGQRLVATVTPRHAVARVGGDEFAVLVEAADGGDEVELLCDTVVAAFNEPFALGPGPVTCTASVGVVTTAEADDDAAQMMGRADVALAMAKSSGKGRWCRYEVTIHTRILERLQLHAALHQAIINGEFLLAYQPVIELSTGSTLGFEALVRWRHPTRGMVPPLDFIEIAEESGLIVQLGEWVLRTAVATACRWGEVRPGDPPYIAVNVSPRQFRSAGFVDLVLECLATSGLPPHRLMLEITESLFLSDRDQETVRTELETLRRLGVRVAIDDFGTGYSSLSYLHRVPVDIVKLDKSFVDTITTSAPQFELVKGIIGLAHTLNLAVVAEGIENPADVSLLIDARCEYGQGYLFSRPVSEDDALAWVRDHPRAVDAAPSRS